MKALTRWWSVVVAGCVVLVAGVVAAGGEAAFGAPGALAVAAANFDPLSVTFVSLETGWALGTSPCASGACLGLRETTDAGRSWVVRPLPGSSVAAADRKVNGFQALDECCGGGLNVRFANPLDGWIYGGLLVPSQFQGTTAPALWSTHDGGLTWEQERLPSGLSNTGSVFDLEAAAGSVYLMGRDKTYGVTVESSPVARDSWHHANAVALGNPAGGGEQSGAFVLQGTRGWLVEGNDRGTTGSAQLASNGEWVSWSPPCASVGNSFAIPAASTPSNLVAVCVMGGFAEGLSKSAPPGATIGSSWLYFSSNGGNSFQAGPELGPMGESFAGVLASPVPGAILIGRAYPGQDLIASFDGGRHWAVVYRGELSYLGFTSPLQGVGIVQSTSATTTMIMTFDGGHHWAPVTF